MLSAAAPHASTRKPSQTIQIPVSPYQYIALVLPADYKLGRSEWFEGALIMATPRRSPCAPLFQIDFYGGFGAGACGPSIARDAGMGKALGEDVHWVEGEVRLKCGKVKWRRALVPKMQGGITLRGRAAEMNELQEIAIQSQLVGQPHGTYESMSERWSIGEEFCR
jgi:hypothetical protein